MPKRRLLQNIVDDFNKAYSEGLGEQQSPNYLHITRKVYKGHKSNVGTVHEGLAIQPLDIAYSLLYAVKEKLGAKYTKSAKLTLENNFPELSGKL